MCARNAPIWIAALEPAQHVLLPGRIEHDRGERDHEIAQRAPGMARLQGFTGRGHGGAVCIDRERAAERDVARCRRGNHAEAIWLERREQRLQRDARLGGDARRTCRRVDGDGRQRLRRIEQHEVRGAGARVQRQRRPVVHVAARAYPVAVRARPVDGRDDVVGGARRGGPYVLHGDLAAPVLERLLVKRDVGREAGRRVAGRPRVCRDLVERCPAGDDAGRREFCHVGQEGATRRGFVSEVVTHGVLQFFGIVLKIGKTTNDALRLVWQSMQA